MTVTIYALSCIILLLVIINSEVSCRNFSIDYEHDRFVKDGKPFQYISATIHYARTPEYYWEDRLKKMQAAGFNTIQTYIFWNFHEPVKGQYNFTGQHNFTKFLKLAQSYGLNVIIRGLPYSCAEWDFGGLPAWLLTDDPHMVVRSMDPAFIQPLDTWLNVILPKLRPLLYKNGGPIITIQVENEYGSYFACDYTYLRYLRLRIINALGSDVVLFTTDGNTMSYLKCGTIDGLYSTVDFGVTNDPEKAFAAQRKHEPHGPLVNSEFYIGWIDHWRLNHSHVDAHAAAKSSDILLSYGANINHYVFAGGTSFGFNNGANSPPFQPQTTSYDFDGILTESGDITPKYMLLREVFAKHNPHTPIPVPPSTPKFAYGKVILQYAGSVFDNLEWLSRDPITSQYPLTMERMHQLRGFVLYQHKLTRNYSNSVLHIEGLRDRAYIAVNQDPHGVLEREMQTSLKLGETKQNDYINILVENMGHINHGSGLTNNSKGILGNVTLDGKILCKWTMYCLKLDSLPPERLWESVQLFNGRQPITRQHGDQLYSLPSFFIGLLSSDAPPTDTFLDPRPFSKGQAYINEVNIGRYWPTAGPQVTLFVPKVFLQPKSYVNMVTLLELEHVPTSQLHVTFTDTSFLNKTVPSF